MSRSKLVEIWCYWNPLSAKQPLEECSSGTNKRKCSFINNINHSSIIFNVIVVVVGLVVVLLKTNQKIVTAAALE